jgi:hypothetical protein
MKTGAVYKKMQIAGKSINGERRRPADIYVPDYTPGLR